MLMKANAKIFMLCIVGLLITQCNQSTSSNPADRAAEEAALRNADMAWSKAAQANQVDNFIAAFLDDAVVLGPNQPITSGKEAITKMSTELFAMPGFALKWEVTKAEVSASGDLGYSYGVYEMSWDGEDGNRINDKGKYMTVWKKQADGQWKTAADMFNSDLPIH